MKLMNNTTARKEKIDTSSLVPLKHRITFRLPLQVSILALVIFLTLGITISISISNIIKKDTEETIAFLSNKNAKNAADYLGAMQIRANSLADAMSSLTNVSLADEDKSNMMQDIMRRVLDDERIFGVYTAWEPNLVFGDSPNGQSFYYYRNQGSVSIDVLQDYDVYKDGDYYNVARDTKKPYMTEPYPYLLTNGNEAWLITISNPIFSDSGTFLGVANTDIVMDMMNDIGYDDGSYTTSYGYILSNEGVFLTHSTDESQIGTSILAGKTGVGLTVAENIISMTKKAETKLSLVTSLVNGEMSYIYQVPMQVEGIDNYLSSTFVVAESEVFGPMYTLQYIVAGVSIAGLLLLVLLVQYLIRKSLRPMNDIIKIADNMKYGILNNDLTITTKDEFGQLANSFAETSNVLRTYIEEISSSLTTLAEGDLRIAIQNEYVGDFGPIKTALVDITDSLQEAISRIGNTADLVNAGATEISSSSQALAAGATQQAATLEELNASIGTVANQARENAEHVQKAANLVTQTTTDANDSSSQMDQLNRSMMDIGDSSKKIAGITKLVEDIAFQTNILALNAAVEAARAGVAGKGFAVVADEVRNLASKSADAAKRTEELVKQSASMIEDGIKVTEQTAVKLKKVVEQTQHINEVISQIENASNVQANAILEITQGLNQVSDVIQTNAATAEESSASSVEMSNQAKVLWEEVQKFTLNDE